jgi:hypothetical protein
MNSRKEEKSTPITCSAKNDFLALHEWIQGGRKNPLQSHVQLRTTSLYYMNELKEGGKNPLHSHVRQRTTSLHYMNGFKEGGKIHSNHTFS